MLRWINILMALISFTVIIFCIPHPQGTWNTGVITALPYSWCFSDGGVPVRGWSAGNKFTDVLMAEGWGTKEQRTEVLHWHWQKVNLFGPVQPRPWCHKCRPKKAKNLSSVGFRALTSFSNVYYSPNKEMEIALVLKQMIVTLIFYFF